MARRRARQKEVQEVRWPRASSLFALALAFLFLITSFGTYQSDEGAQLQGLHNLRQGNIDLEERPRQFYAIEEYVFLSPEAQMVSQQDRDFVNFEALPVYAVLWMASWVVSIPVLLLFGWTAAAYVTTKRGWSRLYEQRKGRPWQWNGEPQTKGVWARIQAFTPSHWLLIGALALWTFSQWVQLEPIDFSTWGETFAVQTANILLSALGFVLFFRLVQHQTGSLRAAVLLSAALLLGPYAAWGIGIKYHAGSMVLTIASLWLYQRTDKWRYAAFLTAGLAIAATPLGLALFGALILVEAVRVLQVVRQGGDRRQLAYLGVGLGVALGVLLAFNHFVMGHWAGHLERFFAADNFEAGREALKSRMRFESWSRSGDNLWKTFMHARAVDGQPIAVWALTPLTALALFAPWRLRRRWNRTLATAGVAAILYIAMFIHGAHINGGTRDLRYFSTLLPMLLLLAGPVIAPRVDAIEATRWRPRQALALAIGGALLFLLILAAADTPIIRGGGSIQVIDLARVVGSGLWVALVLMELSSHKITQRWGEARRDHLWNALVGVSLVTGVLYLLHVTIIEYRVIPPWPFGSGTPRMSYLMPSMETFRQWALDRLLPI